MSHTSITRFGRNGPPVFCLDRNFAWRGCNERRHFARGPTGAWPRGNIGNLLDHVELAQTIDPLRRIGHRGNLGVVLRMHVLNVAQPVVGEADALILQRRRNSAASVVAAHDDVFDVEHIDGELHHRKTVQIGVHDYVGNVAMDEELAWQQADDVVGRYAAVRASDPQVARPLLLRQPRKEFRITPANALRTTRDCFRSGGRVSACAVD